MTLRTYNDLEQRSPEWYAARCGIVTASVVGKLVVTGSPDAGSVGCPTCEVKADEPCLSMASSKVPKAIKTFHPARSAKADALPPIYQVADNDTSAALTATLVAERITGVAEQTFTNDDMMRGIIAEPIARDLYSGHHEQAVEVGFMRRDEDDWSLGYSPDGLVGMDGLIEIKAPRAKGHILTILRDKVPAQHVAQCQAGLLVSGRKWLDFISYHGGLPLFVKRVYPDPEWFEAITAACIHYELTAAEMTYAFSKATTNMPATERLDHELGLVF